MKIYPSPTQNLCFITWDRGSYPWHIRCMRDKDLLRKDGGLGQDFRSFQAGLFPRRVPGKCHWFPALAFTLSETANQPLGLRKYLVASFWKPLIPVLMPMEGIADITHATDLSLALSSVVAVCLHAFPIGAALQDAQPAGHRLRPKPAALLKGMTLSRI